MTGFKKQKKEIYICCCRGTMSVQSVCVLNLAT